MKVSLPVAAITLLGLLCGRADAQELKKLKLGYPAISYNQVHIWVAKDAGLFRKQGLDVEIVFFRGGQTATQALVAGDPPIVNIGLVVQAGLQGHAAVLIASSENTYNGGGPPGDFYRGATEGVAPGGKQFWLRIP
jgi:ABC-type nitrate/sulfonate/bicarbonate transport system substrate-binding protein